jgi:hypothetical protein
LFLIPIRLSEKHRAYCANLEEVHTGDPALRLFGLFQIARKGPEWEPIGVAWLDTTRAVRASNVLAKGAMPLGKENVRKWLKGMARERLLKAVARREGVSTRGGDGWADHLSLWTCLISWRCSKKPP